MICHDASPTHRHSIDRRTLLKYSAASAAALSIGLKSPAVAQTRAIKLGYVSPLTGPLAAFAEADNFIIAHFKEATKGGLKIGNLGRLRKGHGRPLLAERAKHREALGERRHEFLVLGIVM